MFPDITEFTNELNEFTDYKIWLRIITKYGYKIRMNNISKICNLYKLGE